MFATAFTFFWPPAAPARTRPQPPEAKRAPIFIGDAVQPWGPETMLLDILRREEAQEDD